jgi:protein-S-isoprenylcysteine O-methyltransferase Ste14
MKSSKIRHVVEGVLAVLLFTAQNIVFGGPFISVMFIPLFAYLIALNVFYPYLERDIGLLLFNGTFVFGRIIAVIGFAIFLLAAIQFLKERRWLVTTRLYSIVRHPQYAGIIVMTTGLTIMCLTLTYDTRPLLTWFVQSLGYITLARYEEWHLEKKYGKNYYQYKQKVPFILPVRRPSKISETLFTILVLIIIAFILLFISETLFTIQVLIIIAFILLFVSPNFPHL